MAAQKPCGPKVSVANAGHAGYAGHAVCHPAWLRFQHGYVTSQVAHGLVVMSRTLPTPRSPMRKDLSCFRTSRSHPYAPAFSVNIGP